MHFTTFDVNLYVRIKTVTNVTVKGLKSLIFERDIIFMLECSKYMINSTILINWIALH